MADKTGIAVVIGVSTAIIVSIGRGLFRVLTKKYTEKSLFRQSLEGRRDAGRQRALIRMSPLARLHPMYVYLKHIRPRVDRVVLWFIQ